MMFSILSVVTLSASAYAAPNVGTNPCTFGPSYWCASEANAQECNFAVSDCSKYPETALGKQQQLGSNPCTDGPAFYCASEENAAKCHFPVSDCGKYPETPLGKLINELPALEPGPVILPSSQTVIVGSNPCTEGPAFWCASVENAAKCHFAVSDCAKHPETTLGKLINEFPPLEPGPVILPPNKRRAVTEGSDPCTEGPAFWCASLENAVKCHYNAITGCKQYPKTPLGKLLNGRPLLPPGLPPVSKSRRDVVVGSKPCTQGPAYWCASEKNAAQCDFKVADCEKYPDTPLGQKQKLQKCETGCPMYYLPFCATDGNTYGNQCELDSKNCLANTNVKKLHDGAC
eukprot:Pgem_evm1s19822